MADSSPRTHDDSETSLSLLHLEAELTRIDILLHREVWRWQRAGQDPGDPFRGQYVSDDDASALLKRSFGTSWGQSVELGSRQQQAYDTALAQAEQRVQDVVEMARQQNHVPRLLHLALTFGLERFDLDTLLLCLAPALDLRYEKLYGYLQDDVTRKKPSVNLILDLLCEPGTKRLLMLPRFADDSPLLKYHLMERVTEAGAVKPPLLSQTLRVDDAIISWLLGKYHPYEDLGEHARLTQPEVNEVDILLAGETKDDLLRLARSADVLPIVFYGPDSASQTSAARLLAAYQSQPLLMVNWAEAVKDDVSPLHALRVALRDARLTGAIPCLNGSKACLVNDDEITALPGIWEELCTYPGLAIVTSPKRWLANDMERDRNIFWLEFPIPSYTQRQILWQHFLGDAAQIEPADIVTLSGQFQLTTGQIRDAVNSARDAALQRDEPLHREHIFAEARAHSSPRLVVLAHKITPRYGWEDIVLPNDQLTLLREIVATVWGRPRVLEEWGVGEKLASSTGVTVLFSGPPGTGKTMAAGIMARELELDLYKIDLSGVVSKYIGETEKNLERIFSEAENSNAILFFDEADALFGKRSEVRDSHDRFANIEISYLLQRMEAYDGVSILATNLRANLDEAFTRRLQFAVDFPFPEEEYRLRIWRTLFPPTVPRAPDLDFEVMARRFKLAGGNIRNILVNSAYLAAADGGEVGMKHLLHGTRRELQKMGRLLPEEHLTVEGLRSARDEIMDEA